jgi:putative flavoprotein involved in K+ transport
MHELGIVERVPGMYFVGLHFLYSMTSATLMGVGRDAERIAKAIALRARAVSGQETRRLGVDGTEKMAHAAALANTQ